MVSTPPASYDSAMVLAIRDYLATPTGIADWGNPLDATPDVNSATIDARAFFGGIALGSDIPQGDFRGFENRFQVGVRIAFGANDQTLLDTFSIDFARYLHRLLALLSFPDQRQKEGLVFGGTFNGLLVRGNAGVNITPGDPINSITVNKQRMETAGAQIPGIVIIQGNYNVSYRTQS